MIPLRKQKIEKKVFRNIRYATIADSNEYNIAITFSDDNLQDVYIIGEDKLALDDRWMLYESICDRIRDLKEKIRKEEI